MSTSMQDRSESKKGRVGVAPAVSAASPRADLLLRGLGHSASARTRPAPRGYEGARAPPDADHPLLGTVWRGPGAGSGWRTRPALKSTRARWTGAFARPRIASRYHDGSRGGAYGTTRSPAAGGVWLPRARAQQGPGRAPRRSHAQARTRAPATLAGRRPRWPADGSQRSRARRAERQALDLHRQLAGQSAPATVAAAAAGERDQPALAVAGKPALRGAKRHTGVVRRRDKRHGMLGVWRITCQRRAACGVRHRRERACQARNVVGHPRICRRSPAHLPGRQRRLADRPRAARLPVGTGPARAGSRRTRPFHARGSAVHPGSAG
jgi:hypothetical protein